MKFLIVGSGGREGAFAKRLAEDSAVYAVMAHKNKTIADAVADTGGVFAIDDPNSPRTVLDFAVKHQIDYVFVSADDPLANGVVDLLLENNIKAIGGTRDAARIEWDKIYSINKMQELCPEFTPFFRTASDSDGLEKALAEFEAKRISMVVKPQGLTGGKGVKVMPEHLADYQECRRYAESILAKGQSVLLVERLRGHEFTIMGITDGTSMVMAPASYDYPFRGEGDTGPGTGGMGCFTDADQSLPFLTSADLDDCKNIMQHVIDDMRQNNLAFNGVLNGGFFKTAQGIRFMEFNSRFGDPEGINVLFLLKESFSGLLVRIWDKELAGAEFDCKASVVKYVVAPEYPESSREEIPFGIDHKGITDAGVDVIFASCVETGTGRYKTMKKSRVAAFVAVADSAEAASGMVNHAIDGFVSGPLEYRRDIGTKEDLEKLK